MNENDVRNAIDIKQELQETLEWTELISRSLSVRPEAPKLRKISDGLKRCITALRDVEGDQRGKTAGCIHAIHAIDGIDVSVEPLTAEEIMNTALDMIIDHWRAAHGVNTPCPRVEVEAAFIAALQGRDLA